MAKRIALVLFLLIAGLVPSTASAVTADDIITLSKAGVSEAVLLALIDRDKSVFAIEAENLVALKDAGVSEAVVVAMLKSGREPLPPAPPAAEPPFSNFVIVGHGPDRPNTSREIDRFVVPAVPVVSYVVVSPGVVRTDGCVAVNANGTTRAAAASQVGRLSTDLGTRYLASGVGHIVMNPAVPDTSAGSQAQAVMPDCRQSVAPTRPRSRR